VERSVCSVLIVGERESQAIEGDGCEKNEEEMAFNERIGVHTNLTVIAFEDVRGSGFNNTK
jgi:hypothetical protein